MASSPDTGRILLMRHPLTCANVDRYFSGRRDVDLTEKGESQRLRAVDALIAWKPDRIWCSPLCRCLSIGAPAAEVLGIEVSIDPRLAEIEFGEMEGVELSKLDEIGVTFPWPVDEQGRSHPCKGGESFESVYERADSLAQDLLKLDGRTACVTHGGFTRGFIAAAYKMDIREFWHMHVRNVSSQIFVDDHGKICLEAFGLTPEEVMARVAGRPSRS